MFNICFMDIIYIKTTLFLGTSLCSETRNVQEQNMPNEVECCKLYVKLNSTIQEELMKHNFKHFFYTLLIIQEIK